MSGARINSNIDSLRAQRSLAEASQTLASAYQRLSTGLRINRAADDAAGLAVASNLEVSTRINAQGLRNLNDAVSLANVAAGALEALRDIAIRQRELATQAANGSYSLAQRQAMDAEANSLAGEYNRIVGSAKFNGALIFGDDPSGMRIQAGRGVDGSILFGLGSRLARNIGDGSFADQRLFATAGNPQAVTTGDVNGDGKTDIVSLDYFGAWAV